MDPAWRGRGVGTALLQAAEAWARERGATRMTLGLDVFNTGAQRTTLTVGVAAGIHDWYRSTILEDDAGGVGTDATLAVRGAEIVTLGGRRSKAG